MLYNSMLTRFANKSVDQDVVLYNSILAQFSVIKSAIDQDQVFYNIMLTRCFCYKVSYRSGSSFMLQYASPDKEDVI